MARPYRGRLRRSKLGKIEEIYLDDVKLVAALVIEGAIVRVIRGLVDHGLRQAFARTTGSWPGDERPEPEWTPAGDALIVAGGYDAPTRASRTSVRGW